MRDHADRTKNLLTVEETTMNRDLFLNRLRRAEMSSMA